MMDVAGRDFGVVPTRGRAKPACLLLATVVLFTSVTLRSPGTSDVYEFWLPWMTQVSHDGLIQTYQKIEADYPPLSLACLCLVTRVSEVYATELFLVFKASLASGLLVTLFLLLRWLRDASLATILAFSLVLHSVLLGYLDIYYAPSLLLSLWALERRKVVWFSFLFSVSCLIKWQPLIIAPFLVLHALAPAGDSWASGKRLWLRPLCNLVLPALAVIAGTLVIFGTAVLDSLGKALSHPYLSGNALNFNWLVTYHLHSAHAEVYGPLEAGVVNFVRVDPKLWWVIAIKLAFVACYAFTLWRSVGRRGSFPELMRYSLLGYLAYFTLNIGVHENHLFLASILGVTAAARTANQFLRAVTVVVMSSLNLLSFYGFGGGGLGFSRVINGVDVTVVLAAVNVVLFLSWWVRDVVVPRPGDLADDVLRRNLRCA